MSLSIYLRSITALTFTEDAQLRAWAIAAVHDMADPAVSVTEYLEPLMFDPVPTLTAVEQRVRRLITSLHSTTTEPYIGQIHNAQLQATA